MKELGPHPKDEADRALSRPFRAYLKHGRQNVTLPKGRDPDSLTLEEGEAASGEGGQGKATSAVRKARARPQASPAGRQARAAAARRSPRCAAAGAFFRPKDLRGRSQGAHLRACANRHRKPAMPRGRAVGACRRRLTSSALEQAGGAATEHELARALGVKGRDRFRLKRVLRELEDGGAPRPQRRRSGRRRASRFSTSPRSMRMASRCPPGVRGRGRRRASVCSPAMPVRRRRPSAIGAGAAALAGRRGLRRGHPHPAAGAAARGRAVAAEPRGSPARADRQWGSRGCW